MVHLCKGSWIKVLKIANCKLLKLHDVGDSYQELTRLGEREASRQMSVVGGQGFWKCDFKGKRFAKFFLQESRKRVQ